MAPIQTVSVSVSNRARNVENNIDNNIGSYFQSGIEKEWKSSTIQDTGYRTQPETMICRTK